MKYLVLIGLLAACGDESSSSLLTSGMSAEITAQSDGTSTNVTAEVFAGDPLQLIYVDLGSGDQLVAHYDGNSNVMEQQQLLTIIAYVATFDDTHDGDTFTVALDRTLDGGAPNSTMTLPSSFDLDPVPATASRAAAMSLTWSPTSDDAMSWQIEGSCIETTTGTITTDTGSVTIPASMVVLASGSTQTSCDATLTVSRTEPGTLDHGFGHGGDATGEQTRTATFTTAP
ncbi:MAG TPA: hypothetical protein VGG28_13410 [Kofleriaceae bacterium]|jgi:hypothetical protein